MTIPAPVPDALPDRSVVLALQEITDDLLDGAPSPARSAEEAAQILGELLGGRPGGGPAAAARLLRDGADAPAAARRLLALLAADEDTAATAAPVLDDPPVDEQLAVVEVAGGAVVLFALVTWLQTKVHIKVHRQNRKNTIDFELTKEAIRGRELTELAATAEQILGDGAPQP
ncbi:hypothetical protein [Streptomyces benahoarensis]|uniref:Uncharacterized protein n=1 Tax=Streptomyces benahoarensis TaxID=2595054 RepID=A0A553Y7F9_9ACTN|nr:hypothetical protein [Streptomyces benahoarensis]TSB24953.1 hypothetical protein FNZ23_27190 [Streptomyces benahoarensis]TSB30399.1 hypothetical protein FNJ62_08310 [Streptomyces benahoarensis]